MGIEVTRVTKVAKKTGATFPRGVTIENGGMARNVRDSQHGQLVVTLIGEPAGQGGRYASRRLHPDDAGPEPDGRINTGGRAVLVQPGEHVTIGNITFRGY